jgi:hypothetical protein
MMVPPVTLSWYQRTPAMLGVVVPAVFASHSDSVPPRLRYWFCIISRSPSESIPGPAGAGMVFGGLE